MLVIEIKEGKPVEIVALRMLKKSYQAYQ